MWSFAIPAAMALMGANSAQKKADQQQKFNQGQAEVTRYSPWTGMKGQMDNSYSPSALEGGISGGIQGVGAVQGLGLGGSGWGSKTPTTTVDAMNTQVAENTNKVFGNAFGDTGNSQIDPRRVQTGGWAQPMSMYGNSRNS